MSNMSIRQAQEGDIPIIESILLNTIEWVNEIGQPLWFAEDVTWAALSKDYQVNDFYIAYTDGIPSGCMAVIDHDPFFWPDVKRGASLFMHKLAVTRMARKSGVSDMLMNFFKEHGAKLGIKTLRLDTDALRHKTRAFYERHGFVCTEEKTIRYYGGKFLIALYVYTMEEGMR